MALEGGFLEVIAKSKVEPVDAAFIAKETGYDALLIARVMRLVTYSGLCDEVGESEYAANGATQLIITPGQSGSQMQHFDLFFAIGAKLAEYMRKTGVHQFPSNRNEKSPFEYAHGMPFWEFLTENDNYRRGFDDYMAIRRQGLTAWHETFPMATHLCPGFQREDPDAVL